MYYIHTTCSIETIWLALTTLGACYYNLSSFHVQWIILIHIMAYWNHRKLYTVDGLIFVGYKFSWFLWRVRSTNFNYPWISDFLYELWKKILWLRILNPLNVSFSFNPRKLEPKKIKPIYSLYDNNLLIKTTLSVALKLRKMWLFYSLIKGFIKRIIWQQCQQIHVLALTFDSNDPH